MLDSKGRTCRDGGGLHGAQLSVDLVCAALQRQAARWTYAELDPDVFGEQLSQPGYEDVERIAAVWLVASKA